jgi:SAM-dependent MidA family methyltransferase
MMREYASKILPEDVEWYNCISEIGEINGCIISNELVDNFPVHRVVMKEMLMEVYVDYKDGFSEILIPAGGKLCNYISDMNIRLPVGYATEINLQARSWITNIAKALNTGFVTTFIMAIGTLSYTDQTAVRAPCYASINTP